MGTKIKLFNLLIITFMRTQLCAMYEDSWKNWFKHQAYKVTNEGSPYDEFVDKLQSENKTVKQSYKECFKKKHAEALAELQKEFNLSSDQVQQALAFRKKMIKERSSSLPQVTFKPEIPLSVQEKINKVCEKYEMTVPIKVIIRETGYPAGVELDWKSYENLSEFEVFLDLGQEFFQLSENAQYALLSHEIGGHAKHFDSAEAVFLLAQVGTKTEDLEKKFYHSKAVQKLRSFYEIRDDLKPMFSCKDIEHTKRIESGYKTGPWDIIGDNTHQNCWSRYRAAKNIRSLLEAEHRWMMGPKGYEKYATAYDRAFADKYGSSSPVSVQKPVVSKFSKFFARTNNHFEN